MGRCSRCGGSFPDSEMTSVIDASGGMGFSAVEMCDACVKVFMRGKSGLRIGGPGRPSSGKAGPASAAGGGAFLAALAVLLCLIWFLLGSFSVWIRVGLSVAAFVASVLIGVAAEKIAKKH